MSVQHARFTRTAGAIIDAAYRHVGDESGRGIATALSLSARLSNMNDTIFDCAKSTLGARSGTAHRACIACDHRESQMKPQVVSCKFVSPN